MEQMEVRMQEAPGGSEGSAKWEGNLRGKGTMELGDEFQASWEKTVTRLQRRCRFCKVHLIKIRFRFISMKQNLHAMVEIVSNVCSEEQASKTRNLSGWHHVRDLLW